MKRFPLLIVLLLVLIACGGDGISGAANCDDLRAAWNSVLADPDRTGEELADATGRAIARVSVLHEEAEERDNPIQKQTCSDLLVDLAVAGGSLDPTFETCPDGSLALVGECP